MLATVKIDGKWYDTLGDVADLAWSTRYGAGPSGCDEASWTLVTDDRNYYRPEFARGRLVEVKQGPLTIWRGLISEAAPVAGGWTFHARGHAGEASRFEALDSLGLPTTHVKDAVDAAVARGLPWDVSSTSWPTGWAEPVAAADTEQLNKLSALLDAWCELRGYVWAVFEDGVLRFMQDPTSPAWVAKPGTPTMGVADDDYVTHLYVRYVSTVDAGPPVTPTAYGVALASDPDAEALWGRVEEHVDLAPLGLMDYGDAVAHAEGRLAKARGRMGWTNGLELDATQVVDTYGAPADLSKVRAGEMLRILGALDIRGTRTTRLAVDVVVASASFNGSTLRVAPVGMVPRTLSDVLADAVAPPESDQAVAG